MNLNKVILIGRLAADPEVRATQTGQQVASFRIVTNRTWTNQAGEKQESPEFHNVVAWGKLADIIGHYMKKGALMMVEGRIQTRSWVGQDGNKRWTTEVVLENMQMGPRSAGQTSSGGEGYSPSRSENIPAQADEKEEEIPVINEDAPIISDDETEKKEIKLDDIPF